MDGVFMRKFAKFIWTTVLVISMFCLGILLADRAALEKNLIRLHVVANSDSKEDQSHKLQVKDAITKFLSEQLQSAENSGEAYQLLAGQLPKLEEIAREVLVGLDDQNDVRVSLGKETFPLRQYETFSLPSGVYQSIRIEIGQSEGENWWCVVFPSLCNPQTAEAFSAEAVNSGLGNHLTGALSNEKGYEIRFFFLDCIGKLENLFFRK